MSGQGVGVGVGVKHPEPPKGQRKETKMPQNVKANVLSEGGGGGGRGSVFSLVSIGKGGTW